ncbi:unnamed protein product, partial [Mesorhabditis belari]|uniref:Uncharacterized protein n=1 Tax=Mesorhabditis belari TaxID=2138241 RepID=A0AAF3FHZ6_9BILA
MDSFCPPRDLFPEKFSPELDKDFRDVEEILKFRGGSKYHPPIGSFRFALNLLEFGNHESNEWIAGIGNERECDEETGEWPVAYHGTSFEQAIEIVGRGGFQMPPDNPSARIHTVNDPKVALGFAKEYSDSKGETFKLLFQVRIDLKRADVIKKDGVEYWRARCVDAIRAYAICVYKVK